MKVTVDKKILKAALIQLSDLPGVAKSASQAAYSRAVRFSADMMGLKMTRFTDTSIISVTIDADIDEEGETNTPHDMLTRVANGMPLDTITLTTKKNEVFVTSGRGLCKLPTFLPEELDIEPPEPEDGALSLDLPAEDLAIWLKKLVDVVADPKDDRTFLQGVNFNGEQGDLWLTATNGRQMHFFALDYKLPVNVIVPGAAVRSIVTALQGLSGACKLSIGKSTIRVEMSSLEMGFALLADKYPNIHAVIAGYESSIESKFVVERASFIELLRKCASMSSLERKMAYIESIPDGIKISASSEKDEFPFEFELPASWDREFNKGFPLAQFAGSLEAMTIPDEDGKITVSVTLPTMFVRQGERYAGVALHRRDKEAK